jgi:methionyl aminopeptidase
LGVIKSRDEIEKIRAAGKVVARTIRLCSESIVPGKTTTKDIDALAARLIAEAGGTPSFLNYRGYPASTCLSVNDVVIHGIPGDLVLHDGDIIDIDVGVKLNGWHADSAWTFAVGTITPEAQRLLNVTRESLFQGIAKAKPGNKVGDIGAAVQKYVEMNGYSVVRDLVGHGIGQNLHEAPGNIPNFGKAGKGETLREGMTICIEPMVNAGRASVKTLSDQWTVLTVDGSLSAHFEHTIALTANGPEILTLEDPA